MSFTTLSENTSYRRAASHGELCNYYANMRTAEFAFRSKQPALHRRLEGAQQYLP